MKHLQLILALLVSVALSQPASAKRRTHSGSKKDPLKGLTINVIGDSYVANHRCPKTETWHYRVAERHGMTYNNYGRNGGSIAWDRSKRGFGRALWDRCLEMTDTADIVLVIAGHNDATLMGTNLDSLHMFRDSLTTFCQRLRAKYPKARIGFVSPWHVDRPGFKTVIATLREYCQRYGFGFLDTKDTPIEVEDDAFRKRYFQNGGRNDKAHLNAEGHALMLPCGEAFLESLVRKK